MTFLAVDTATELLLVLFYKNGQTFTYVSPQPGQNHSSALFPAIQSLLHTSGTKISEIDFFSCATGPGSFTGLRIGISGVKGLAEALGKPMVGFSSLDAMGWDSRSMGKKTLCVIDARKGKFYVGLYENGVRVGELQDLTPEKAAALLTQEGPVVITGYQGKDLAHALNRTDNQDLPSYWFKGIVKKTEEAWQSGQVLAPDAGPLYIRLSEAEENRIIQP